MKEKIIASAQPTGIRAYFAELAKYPPLRMEQEAELARRIAAGSKEGASPEERAEGKAAKDKLVLSNGLLVATIASEYLGRGLGYEDLVCEGNLGLMRAADAFDPECGYKFGTYAGYWIREKIGKALADDGRTIRVPANVIQAMGTVGKAIGSATQRLGRAPMDDEIIAEIGDAMPAARVKDLLRFMACGQGSVDSLNMPYGPAGSEIEAIDMIASDSDPASRLVADDRKEVIRKALAKLGARDRRLIELRYGLDGHGPKTFEMTSLALASEGYVSPVDGSPLTRERIRQLEEKILTRLSGLRMIKEVR